MTEVVSGLMLLVILSLYGWFLFMTLLGESPEHKFRYEVYWRLENGPWRFDQSYRSKLWATHMNQNLVSHEAKLVDVKKNEYTILPFGER